MLESPTGPISGTKQWNQQSEKVISIVFKPVGHYFEDLFGRCNYASSLSPSTTITRVTAGNVFFCNDSFIKSLSMYIQLKNLNTQETIIIAGDLNFNIKPKET